MDTDVRLIDTISELKERVQRLLQEQQRSGSKSRILIALAGVPGSGKSTVSHALLGELSKGGFHDVAILPMVS